MTREHGLSLPQFLARRGVLLEEVHETIRRAAGFDDGDILFVSGSLVEELGNDWSDVDAYLITAREVVLESFGNIAMLDCSSIPVDLEIWRPAQIEKLVVRLAEIDPGAACDVRHALSFSSLERELLHRILIGLPLAGSERFAELRAAIDPVTLSRLIFDRSVARINSAHIDLFGLIDSGDATSGLFMIQTLLGFVADALLATMGNTNPSEKWRHRKLRQLDDVAWDIDLPGGPLPESIASIFLTLHNPPSLDDATLLEHAHDAVRLANRIVPWGQQRFFQNRVTAEETAQRRPVARGFADGAAEDGSAPLPLLRLDASIQWYDSVLLLSFLKQEIALGIGPIAHDVLCRFDGKTTRDEVLRFLAERTPASRKDLLQAIDDMELVLRDRDLLLDRRLSCA